MEDKSIVILNHCYILPEIARNYQQLIYAPIFKSPTQKIYHEKVFEVLINFFPEMIWSEHIKETQSFDALAFNSFNEHKIFSQNLLNIHNHLFDDLPFDVPEGFTAFRKKAEPLLPKYFENAILPFCPKSISEIDYYFGNPNLPLNYFETRNQMVGRDGSTKFSSMLANGLIDVKYLYNRVKIFEKENRSNKSTYWIIFELLWREFFFWHYQKHQNKYFSKNGLRGELDFSPFEKYSIERLKEISPSAFFTAALNELQQTGFMSNRARQMFASQWINDLEIDWRSGAYLFEEYLIDFDVFSNYGNWMYLAGVGVDPRGKRYFNIPKQLKIYDPDEKYIQTWGDK